LVFWGKFFPGWVVAPKNLIVVVPQKKFVFFQNPLKEQRDLLVLYKNKKRGKKTFRRGFFWPPSRRGNFLSTKKFPVIFPKKIKFLRNPEEWENPFLTRGPVEMENPFSGIPGGAVFGGINLGIKT
jgi:hypothetical protein